MIYANENGAVELYEDNSKKLETGISGEYGSFTATNGTNGWDGMAVAGSKFVFMGSGADDGVGIWNDSENEWMIKCTRNAQTVLYYDGSAKISTNSSGATVTGTCTATTFSGSGASLTNVNATTLDSIDSGSFIRSDTDDSIGYEHQIRFNSDSAINTSTAYKASLEVYSGNGAGTDAFMAFHVSGDFACYFGLDGGINDIAVGGWSFGGVSHRVWHAGNDGSGSGLDADTLDGVQGSSFLRSDTNDTISAALTTKILQFTGVGGNSNNSTQDYAIYQEGGAWSAPYPDLVIGYHTGIKIGGHKSYNGTRFYNDAPGRSGATEILSVGNGDDHIRVANNLYVAGRTYIDNTTNYLAHPTGDYGSVQVNGSGVNSWEGYSIDGRVVFMHDGSNSAGIYNDVNNEWMIRTILNGAVELYHNNNLKLYTTSYGAELQGDLRPSANNTYNLGSSSYRWANLYVNDMHFANSVENPNKVDGTWGDWTLQEGEDTIYMLNNRNGKKYKMNLTEVS